MVWTARDKGPPPAPVLGSDIPSGCGSLDCVSSRSGMNKRHASIIELGNAVRSARSELGISQNVLAATAGVGARFVVELEAGKETVQLDKVLCVLDVLGIELRFARPSHQM